MNNYPRRYIAEVLKRAVAPVAAATIALAGCSTDLGVKATESSTTTLQGVGNTLAKELSRSYSAQPVLVEQCPSGGIALPKGSLVQADLLGRNGFAPA